MSSYTNSYFNNEKKKLVVIINGKGGVGKDTLCESVAKKYRIRNISSITPIKEIAAKYGWNGEKDLKSRRFLAELKRVFTEYNDMPTQYLLEEHAKFLESDDQVLFVHIREADQITSFAKKIGGNCVSVLVKRNAVDSAATYGNAADDNVDGYPYDVVFANNGTLEEGISDFTEMIDGLFECSFK